MVDQQRRALVSDAAYLYVLHLDGLALALGVLPAGILTTGSTGCAAISRPYRRHRKRHSAGACACWKTRLRMRDAHPPGCLATSPWCSSTRCRSPLDAATFAFWRIPGHKQPFHDGKKLALIAAAQAIACALRWRLVFEDGMVVACVHRGGAAAPARSSSTRCGPGRCQAQANTFRAAEPHFAGALDATPRGRVLARCGRRSAWCRRCG